MLRRCFDRQCIGHIAERAGKQTFDPVTICRCQFSSEQMTSV